jgi:enoyl-[acyl-carrier protein] reductase/trans-2-enoyl-CoA reductase (NAD+)
MIIKPELRGNVARNCHPEGCIAAVQHQIDAIRQMPAWTGAGNMLVVGGSSGYGLACRQSAAFGGSRSATLNISYEKGTDGNRTGTAGWYNNLAFQSAAEADGLWARDIIGDAFDPKVMDTTKATIRDMPGGQINTLVFSLATGRRKDYATGEQWTSALGTIGKPFSGLSLNMETMGLEVQEVQPATEQQIEDTVRVMGGDGWSWWISQLAEAGLLARGFRTLAFSYIGPELTHPIYTGGTLGRAKTHLLDTGHYLDRELQSLTGGHAYVVCGKALVTKASAFIPAFSVYISILFDVMKAKGIHEGVTEHIHRLFMSEVFHPIGPRLDAKGMIRPDSWELREDVQKEVSRRLSLITPDALEELADVAGYRKDFMALNGFDIDGVDYNADVDLTAWATRTLR